jgi:A/G-specific adenine glycosylase
MNVADTRAAKKPSSRTAARKPRNSSATATGGVVRRGEEGRGEGGGPQRQSRRGHGSFGQARTREGAETFREASTRGAPPSSQPSPPEEGGEGARRRAGQPGCSAKSDRFPDPAALLAWFDRHRRDLPWRAKPGQTADPYRVWLSEIMLQQTTVKTVAPYFARFLARFPSVGDLASADIEDVLKLWAGLGYYARARNLHACAKAVAARGGFPDSEEQLRALPGIGPYTAAAIAAIAFDRPAAPVDGNVERVVARLYAVEEELPNARPAIRALAGALAPAARPGDFAQAMMDLGATVCTPARPACALCPFMGACAAQRRGDPETFPRKRKKAEGLLRRGAAFVAIRTDGSVLVRRRAASGLLGGMTEVPTTAWTQFFDPAHAVAEAPRFAARSAGLKKVSWLRVDGVVTHVFTHFPLELVVFRAHLPQSAAAPEGTHWLGRDDIAAAALPTVMRKVLDHALNPQDRISETMRAVRSGPEKK